MRVMVTGSSGFIGQHLATALARAGHELIRFDREEGSICDAAFLRASVRQADAEAIINLAGMLGTEELFQAEYRAAEANILGAINVYDTARLYEIPVVQIGTGHKGQPNPYAITKACAEDLGLARAQWLSEKITVVRGYHVYGSGQLPGPPHGRAHVHKFFPTFACQALTRGGSLELCGGGEQLIDPVHVSDVAQVLVRAIGGPYGTVIEAGCGKEITVAQVAVDICEQAQSLAPIRLAAPRAGEPMLARVVAAEPACGHVWPYKVAETVEWYRQWLTR